MSLTLAALEQLAPDQASLAAARKLLAPGLWPALVREGELLWGLYQGSGATPYRVVFDGAERASKCTCPSRKFPCKHALALAWLGLERAADFGAEARPDWVQEWLGRRRKAAAALPAAEADGAGEAPRAALAALGPAVSDAEEGPVSSRGQAARTRTQARRAADTLAALGEVDRWIGDILQRGALAAVSDIAVTVRPIVRRLADAKASTLATRVEELPGRLAAHNEALRPQQLVAELGELHLIAEAYRRSAELPPQLVADARRAIGWPDRRDELQRDASALRLTSAFTVAAQREVLQSDRLVRCETWLVADANASTSTCTDTDAESAPRVALLVDFMPVAVHGGRARASGGLSVGERLAATVLFHPSAAPLRAEFDEAGPRLQADVQGARGLPSADRGLARALEEIDSARARLPWCGARALHADACTVREAEGGALWLVDVDLRCGLPIARGQREAVWPLLGLAPFTAFGVVEGGVVELGSATTELGPWGSP